MNQNHSPALAAYLAQEMSSPQDIETFLARFYPQQRLTITPFGYLAQFLALAQGGQLTTTIPIAANADFLLVGFRHRANIGAAQNASTKVAPFVRILIVDSGTNEQYTNGPVDLENYSSNIGYLQDLPYPRIISGRSALTVQVTNFAPTAETYTTLEVYLEGVLIRAFTG